MSRENRDKIARIENQKLKKRVEYISSSTIGDLANDILSLKSKITALENNLTLANGKITALENALDTQNQVNTDLANRITALESTP